MPKGQGKGTREYNTGPATSPRRTAGFMGAFSVSKAAKRFRKKERDRLGHTPGSRSAS